MKRGDVDNPVKASHGESRGRWPEGIAIVGMSARFPGCRSVEEYWAKVAAGENLLSVPTDEELRAAGVDPATADAQHFVRSGTHLEDAESFDAKFFDITRREAEILDPQQRILLECAYEALEHAGMTGDGERVGVFAGAGMNTYLLQLLGNPEFLASAGGYQLMLGNDKDFLATRVAYKLNLRGPAVTVQTACSTSLAAVHLACQSLLSGECDSALAGGVSVMFPQVAGYQYIPGMILSPDGFCRPFDAKAHGTVPGRGAGLVVLKRLSNAQAAGDTIYGVIAGSAWNNDGSGKVGYTAPSVEGQVGVIRAAHAAAGVDAARIGYVEAHGTGTELGDPIEVAALAEAFGARAADAAKCVLGSVKANMGHGDVAAGVAGLIKAVLAVHHGVIPPTPHFERANPELGIERTPFRVSAESVAWPDAVRWAGVSSFGIGGTNVHLCLTSAPVVEDSGETEGPWLLPLSAKTGTALVAGVERLADWADGVHSLADAAATSQSGRRVFAQRRAVVAGSGAELAAILRKPVKAEAAVSETAQVVFLFPGQGQQFVGMASGLYARDARFRELVDLGLGIVPGALAAELLAVLLGTGAEDAGEMETALAQPLLFLTEYALARRWMETGVQPAVLVGHSLGELTAATVAGVFSFEDGMRLAVVRGRLMQETPAGAMLAVSLPAEAVSESLGRSGNRHGELWIAAENAPKMTVVSGADDVVAAAAERFAEERVATVRLKTNRAFHTPHMAEAAEKFRAAVEGVERNKPRLRWLSNVSGTWIRPEEAISPQYWADQMTSRVRFAENAAVLARSGNAGAGYFFLEVGPGDALGTLVRQQDRKAISAASVASTLGGPKREGDDFRAFLEAAAGLWERGVNLRWEKLPGFAAGKTRRVALPTYAFDRERYWVEASQTPGAAAGGTPVVNPLEKRSEIASWFYAPSWQRTPGAAVSLPARSELTKSWVILDDGKGFGARLGASLEAQGAQVALLALPDGDLRGEFEQFWKANPDVMAAGPVGLVHCWSLSAGDSATESGSGAEPYTNFLQFLQTAQSSRVRFTQIEVVVDGLVSVAGEEAGLAGPAVIEGMARVLPAEFAGVPVRMIDLKGAGDAGLLLAEMGTVASSAITVAYRNGVRWQQVWLPMRLEMPQSSRIRTGGTYLITGGLGGVGFLLARHLLTKYGARVAMVGRTALPVRERWEEWLTENGTTHATSVRIQRAKELEAAGGELLLLSADVGDQEAIEAAWETVEGKFGPVHGVIHAAGLPGGARIGAQTVADAEEVLRPKIRGSAVLAGLLMDAQAGRQVDFLVFCSSISAVLPIAGASSYAAANAFQDRYAGWLRQKGIPALAMNFDAWQEVGMAAEMQTAADFASVKEARLRKAMSPSEGIEVFERALAADQAQVLISTVDFAAVMAETWRVATESGIEGKTLGGKDVGRAAGSETESADLSAETLAVMAIWQELLGADSIEPTDNFFELGGHSLLGTMVLARVRERFGVELTIRAIFEAPTPESLGSRIREAESAEPEAQTVGAGGDREDFEF